MAASTHAPIFVHSSYRVASTWFFSRLRAIPNVRAYYEIFHERLATLTEESLSTFGANSWRSGHPRMAPYFDEFRGLLAEGGGVRGFSPELPYGCFIPKDGALGDITETERDYVGLLIRDAQENQRTPVLTCKRSLARAAGLKRAFGGRHVLLVRDLYPQWVSYVRNASGPSYYFLTVTLQCLLNGRADPFLGQVFESRVIKHKAGDVFQMVRFLELSHFLDAFIAVHIYFYMAAHRSADVVINLSDMTVRGRAAHDVEAELAAAGLAIDLTGCRKTDEAAPVSLGVRDETFSAWALQQSAATLGLGPSDDAYRFAAQMLDQFNRDFSHREPKSGA
jgi:hypothetical protein